MEPVLARDLRFSWTQTDIFIESYKMVKTAAVRIHDFLIQTSSFINERGQMDVQLHWIYIVAQRMTLGL